MVVSPSEVMTINARVEALKKSGLWSSMSLGFNCSDCDAYFQRAGVNNLTGRCEVLWFVRGLKSLDLYKNAVFWPMRSHQNAGTGSTVYSLGGLGVYNGTMVNSPTWGRDGLTNSNTSGVQVGPSVPVYTNHTALFVTNVTGNPAVINERYFDYGTSGVGGARYLAGVKENIYDFVAMWDSTNTIRYRNGYAATLNTFEMMGYSVSNGSLLEASKNSSNYISATPPVMSSGVTGYIGLGNFQSLGSFGLVGVLSSYLLLSKFTNSSTRLLIYSLLKNTINSSLGLP